MEPYLKILALFLVAIGALFLLRSLVTGRVLLKDEYGNPRGWRMLFFFVVLFLLVIWAMA